MLKLQVIISPQYGPFLNRSVEQYLTEHQEEGGVTMYLWKNQQTVVIGYNQNPYSECNVKLLLDEGGYLMRRGTGGGAVYHDLGNINFSFIADKKNYDVRKQLSVIQEALHTYGLETEISGRNDLTCQGRKFSGNAFYSGRINNLHHGTILIKTDGEMMQRYLTVDKAKLQKHGVKSVASRVVNLSELVEMDSESIKQPLIKAFEKVYGGKSELINFNDIAQTKEVQDTCERIGSYDFLFAKWDHFKTYKKAQFPWGSVAIDLKIEEKEQKITEAVIASDSLDTEIIRKAEGLLRGCSTQRHPVSDDPVLNDIFNLVFG